MAGPVPDITLDDALELSTEIVLGNAIRTHVPHMSPSGGHEKESHS